MRDIIDERNEKERISRSIIKYWNVNYIVPEPPKEELPDVELDDDIMAIINRLDNEAQEDEAAKQAEIEQAKEEYRQNDRKLYNAATGAYSGVYGQNGIDDEVTKGQIDAILHERSDELRDLIAQGNGEK